MLSRAIVAAALAVAANALPNIVQTAQSNPNLSDLVTAVVDAGLVNTLSTAQLTVFAPLNSGFANLGANTLDFLLNPYNVDQLTNALTYHVVSGSVTSNQLSNGQVIATVDNKLTLTVSIVGSTIYLVDSTGNKAKVVQANIQCSNGYVHIIDSVLVPSNLQLPTQDIVTLASATPQLSTLVTAVKAANLVSALSFPNGPYTVFAPTNAAFSLLPAATLQYLLAHPAELALVLEYHVVAGRTYSTQIQNFLAVPTLEGEQLVFVISGGAVLVNGNATVTTANVQASNGVVHIINYVLIPAAVGERIAVWTATQEGAPTQNLVQLAASRPELSTLVAAVQAAGLVNTLATIPVATVLAPTNTAFGALPSTFVNWLLQPANKASLATVLTYHVIAANVTAAQLVNGESVQTVEGQNVTVTVNATGAYFNNAQVTVPNLFATNGVVHEISAVLLPVGGASKASKLASMAMLRGTQ